MPDNTTVLSNAIADTAAYYDSPPPNEACTCYWIVDPILKALGYDRKEILPQLADGGNQYPDYTILPGTDFTWYLEAKAWSVSLQDSHVQQSLNYANQNGKRWVVLTSGRRWRLYDNHVIGVAADKLVADMELRDGATALEFLRAISRDSMTSGRVESYAGTSRLNAVLSEELANPESDLIRAVWQKLRSRPGLAGVTRQQVAEAIQGQGAAPPPPPPPSIGKRLKAGDDETGVLDTVVVPARPDGFQRAFINSNAWWAIRISQKRLPEIKYIAAYQVSPISAITHIAAVDHIEPYADTGKYKVVFAEPAQEIGPIRPSAGTKTSFLQSPRFASYERIKNAKALEEVF